LTTTSTSAPPAGVTQPIGPALFNLALPVLASQLLRLGYQWVDALWVQPLGVEATAAVTTSIFVMWWVYSLNDANFKSLPGIQTVEVRQKPRRVLHSAVLDSVQPAPRRSSAQERCTSRRYG